MISRKRFLSTSIIAGMGLLISPLGATSANKVLTEREAAGLDAVLKQMNQGYSTEQTVYSRDFQPRKILNRIENKKGYQTSFRAVNGSLVVLEDFGKPLVRVCL